MALLVLSAGRGLLARVAAPDRHAEVHTGDAIVDTPVSLVAGGPTLMAANYALHRSPDAAVTRLASATRAPAAGAGELRR